MIKVPILDNREDRNWFHQFEHPVYIMLGGNNKLIERKLKQDMKLLKWREWWKNPRKKIDLLSGTEDGCRWRVRLLVNSFGDMSVVFDFS